MSKIIRKTINTITAVGALAVAAPAPAIATSGSLLYDRCTAWTAKGEGFCYGYIVAIMEAPTTDALAICSPNGATNQQANEHAHAGQTNGRGT
ncbi:MAG: Rap1a/Tai family immunity protein [Casimicrobiaceae bacterium]